MDALDKAAHYTHVTFDRMAHTPNQTAEVLGEKSEDLLDATLVSLTDWLWLKTAPR